MIGRDGDRTCDHCEMPPLIYVTSPAGAVELCLEHVKLFTGWTADTIEGRMSKYSNHIGDAMRLAHEIEVRRGMEALGR